MQWSELAAPWQTCWQEAWEACRVGCVPVGAVILDENGREISRGRNRIGVDAPPGQIGHSDLAHAEMNALIQVDRTRINTHTCILYTLLEPCPLCMGAIYMVGVRTVAYAARDAFAGSINLLGATPYYSRKNIRVIAPFSPAVEAAVVALNTARHLAAGFSPVKYADLYTAWEDSSPNGYRVGIALYENGTLAGWQQEAPPAEQIYTTLIKAVTQ